MDDIQSWWEVPSIAHFCSLFRAAFNLLDFDIEELEEALLTDGAEDNGSSLLQELIVRLLCGCVPNGNEISVSNYQMYLRRLFRKKCKEFGIVNPFNADTDFQFLPLRTKVEILSCLCDFRLEGEDVQDLLKNLEADSLRVEPLGQDASGAAYWYFYGTRLYKETYPLKSSKKKKPPKNKGRHSSSLNINPDAAWQVVCYTADDWEKLAQTLENSDHPAERALHHTLAVDFLPEIPRLFAEKERLHLKRMMEYQPRRTSSRINKLNKQKEADTKPEKPPPEKKPVKSDKVSPVSSKSKSRAVEKIYTSSEDEADDVQFSPVKKFIEENSVDSSVKEEKIASSEKEEVPEEDISKAKKGRKNRKRGHESDEDEEEAEVESVKSSKKLRSKHDDSKKEKKHKNSSHKSHKKKPKVSSENESADEQKKRKKGHQKLSSENESAEDHKKKKKSQKSKSHSSRHSSRIKHAEVEDVQSEEEIVSKRKTRKSSPSSSKKASALASAAPVGRQTNNSLACATGPIIIEEALPKKRKMRSSEVFAQSDEDLQTGMYKILERLKTHPDAWPFTDAVEEDYAPRYYTIVRHPMDLQRMEDKLDSGRYLTFDDFKADFKLIITNCKKYNGSENEYSEMADSLEAAFERAACRYLENEFSTDEEVAIEYTKNNVDGAKHDKKRKSSKSSTAKSPEPEPVAEEVEGEEEERHSSKHKKNKKKVKDGSKKSHRKHHHRKSSEHDKSDKSEAPTNEDNDDVETDVGEGSSKFCPPPVGPYGKRRAGPPQPPKVETVPKKSEKRKQRDSGDDEDDDETFSTGDVDRENKSHRKDSSKSRPIIKKRKGGPRSNAAIEALEIATEQTLKDINKWLDDTPRFSEFSSASNSPAHYIGTEEFTGASTAIEREYRKSLRLDSAEYLRLKKRRRDLLGNKDKRRRDLQRTIERFQPGKSKGNLIASIIKAKDEQADTSVVPSIKPLKEKVAASTSSKVDENAPTLSLGSVLTGIGFGRHSFKKEDAPVENESDDKESEDEKPEEVVEPKEDVQESKEEDKEVKEAKVEEEDIGKVDCNKATPNLSAWFKAFGAPKPAPPKKKEDTPSIRPAESKSAQKSPVTSPTEVVAPPAQRQRNLSTGSSSISDLSSPFSQDPEMSPRDTPKAACHQSPPMASPTSPRTPFSSQVPANYPYNGSIKVGFYQEHKTSPEKSPRDESLPMVPSPVQTVKPPQATPPYSTTSRHYNEQQIAHYTQQQQLPPAPPVVMEKPAPVPHISPPVPPPVMQQPYSQNSMLYDMSKPLTDQYRETHKPLADQYRETLKPMTEQYRETLKPMTEQYRETLKPMTEQYRETHKPITEQYREAHKPLADQYREAHKPQPVQRSQAPPAAHSNTPMIPDYSKFDYTKLNYGQPQPYKTPVLLPPPPQSAPDPKLLQQYPVKKRMVYTATDEERYSSAVDLYQQNQRLVAPPLPTYFDPTPPSVYPPYDLSATMPKEPPPQPAKPKRGRKKAAEKAPVEKEAPAFSSFPLGGLKPPPGVVPGSAFNFGPPPGLHLYSQEFNYRNFKLKSPPPSVAPPVSSSGQTGSFPVATSDSFHQAASYYHHQFTQAATGTGPGPTPAASRSNYMMEQQLYQQYFQRPENLLQPRHDPSLLHQGLYAPAPSAYHHSLGIRQPFDVNRPGWL